MQFKSTEKADKRLHLPTNNTFHIFRIAVATNEVKLNKSHFFVQLILQH